MKAFNVKNPIIPIGTVLNSSFVSQYVSLKDAYAYAIQVFFGSGTASGVFSLQVSSDPLNAADAQGSIPSGINIPTHWSPLDNSSFTVTTAPGSVGWNYDQAFGYNWVQVVYTDSSGGTGTAAVTVVNMSEHGV